MKTYLDLKCGLKPFYWNEGESRNILFISLDMVPPLFYLNKNEEIRTPNLDYLRKEGWFFKNAFSSSPLCTPSRASLLTGRYSYITGNPERGHDGHTFYLREQDIIFPEYLKAAGYHLRHFGKCHIGSGRVIEVFGENATPWDRWSPPWYDDDEYLTFLKCKGYGPIDFNRKIYGLDSSGLGEGNFYGGWIAPDGENPFTKDITYPAFLVDKVISALEVKPRRTGPFYFQLDFFGPHQPFAIPAGVEEREREIRKMMKLPESYIKLMENDFKAPWPEPRIYRMYRKNWGLMNEQIAIDYRVANQLQYELLDEQIGRLFDYLKKVELYDDTWIIFIADHGEMNGEMALIDKGSYLNPLTIRVPVIVKPPQSLRTNGGGKEIESLVSLLDLAPTILEIGGIRTECRLDGICLSDFLDKPRPEDKPVLFEVWSHVMVNPSVGMVFQAENGNLYSFIYNACDDQDELYRLDNKSEYLNLIEDSGMKTIRKEAIGTMARFLAADPRWFGYSQYINLEYSEELPGKRGDTQFFRKE